MIKLYVFSNDKRNGLLKEMYTKEDSVAETLESTKHIVCSIPFTKDGVHLNGTNITIDNFITDVRNKIIFSGAIPREIKRQLEINNIIYYDLMDSDEMAYLNAIPTAEGAIKTAMEETDYTLHGSNVMVLGFGRVAKVLASKLKGLDVKLFCAARSKKDLALINAMGYNVVDFKNLNDYISNMNIIFSTIPTMVLGESRLKILQQDCLIIDLSSSPGSVDYSVAKKLNINARLELAIPSKVAPKSAAKYMKDIIDNIINER